MRVKFLRDTTVDFVNHEEGEKTFHRHDVIEIVDIIAVSPTFTNIVLPNGATLIDVRNDWFEQTI